MISFRRLLIIGGIIGGLSAVAAAVFVYCGVYNVSALAQHTPPVYRLLQFAMVRSVAVRGDPAEVPELRQLDWKRAGLSAYDEHCLRCHGGPGVAPESFSLGMVPAPTAIVSIARKRDPAEIFWVIKHGIKMTGMPAWQYRMSDREMWEVVAFVEKIPDLRVAEYFSLRNQLHRDVSIAEPLDKPQHEPLHDSLHEPKAILDSAASEDKASFVEQGHIALQQYNCSSCHSIPGVTAAGNHVGPPLGGITERAFIAGILKNTDENLVRWIRFPRKIDPKSAMPSLGVTEVHARQMVAYFKSMDETTRDPAERKIP
jgi:mono/diheme cytochrome c family protein